MTESEKYFRKLKKLIKNPPKGLMVRYDYMGTCLYVVASDADFIDNEKPKTSAIIGSTTPQNGQGYSASTGYEFSSIIGTIDVDMEAMQHQQS